MTTTTVQTTLSRVEIQLRDGGASAYQVFLLDTAVIAGQPISRLRDPISPGEAEALGYAWDEIVGTALAAAVRTETQARTAAEAAAEVMTQQQERIAELEQELDAYQRALAAATGGAPTAE